MNHLIPRKTAESKNIFTDLLDIQNQMNDLFDFSIGRWNERGRPAWDARWLPAVDVHDQKEQVVVKADLPGLNKEDIDISIQEGVLVIKGEKKEEAERKEKGILRAERYYGAFYREIALPSFIDESKIKATHKNGVLEVTIPKKEEAKPKSIKIDLA